MMTLKMKLSLGLANLLCAVAYAGPQPTLSLITMDDPVLAMTKGEARVIQYQLKNNGNNLKRLTLKPVNGIVQEVNGAGLCQNPVSIKPGEACTLRLSVKAEQAISHEATIPLLCEPGTNWHDADSLTTETCVHPKKEEQLRIQETPKGLATLSIQFNSSKDRFTDKDKGFARSNCFASFGTCTMEMFAGGGSGSVTITNTSNIDAQNIAPTLPAGWTGIGITNGCAPVLLAHSSCTLSFNTLGASKQSTASIMVSGTNTGTIAIPAVILGVGDSFQNGRIYLIDSGANTGMLLETTEHTGFPWATGFYSTNSAAGTGSVTAGELNTSNLVALVGVSSTYAAGVCYQNTAFTAPCAGAGQHCWFLPALNQAGDVKTAIDTVGNVFGVNLLSLYWMSTQSAFPNNNADAMAADYTSAVDNDTAKTSVVPITRCIRTFAA